jgi:hypothetical protein
LLLAVLLLLLHRLALNILLWLAVLGQGQVVVAVARVAIEQIQDYQLRLELHTR